MAPALAERLEQLYEAPEALDPADADEVGDGTAAGRRRKVRRAVPGLEAPVAEKGRLPMRAGVPVLEKYRGKSVKRSEVFEESSAGSDDEAVGDFPFGGGSDEEDDDGAGEANGQSGMGASFSISQDLEAGYDKLMERSKEQLQVMRTPSTAEVAKRELESKRLKQRLASWNSLVEFRIHLEGALGFGHQLPVADAHAALVEKAGKDASTELEGAATEISGLLGSLLSVQRTLASRRGVPGLPAAAKAIEAKGKKRRRPEAEAWEVVDAQLQSVLGWGLSVADDVKARTTLDVRRSFKVLDQSLATQMSAVDEAAPEKLRRRCTPEPGKHAVIGAALRDGAYADAAQDGGNGEEADIFDDRDFYVQLLREVLASGGAPGTSLGGDGAKDLQQELQGRRAAKKARRADVERRASKGRKVRYVAIEKLQNFMAPKARLAQSLGVGEDDSAAEALMRSLFI